MDISKPYGVELIWPTGGVKFTAIYSTIPVAVEPEKKNWGTRSFASHHIDYVGEVRKSEEHIFHVLDSTNSIVIIKARLPHGIITFDWIENNLFLVMEQSPDSDTLHQLNKIAISQEKSSIVKESEK